ncbi:MAG: succinyl-diaminopimelate desuccinylase [Alphaproteobacteria bacterium]|nr:succinyl-diaminopimelate desuccinylase [Alphaproteobacteria bacterium]
MIDPLLLSQKLISCPSITPKNEGALEILEDSLYALGFTCERFDFEGIVNLYAYIGSGHPHLCFAGHTDVVPLGEASLWTHPPFQGVIHNDRLWGRGTADMKCAIACFISALSRFLNEKPFKGTISLLITGDEEKDAIHGTQRVLPIIAERGHLPDLCLIGEPTSLNEVGDTLKIGRRGSVVGKLICYGTQGHIAYPQYTDNPIPRMLNTLKALYEYEFDKGTDVFEPTRLEITSIDVGNTASNIVPQRIEAHFGIRLNILQDAKDLCEIVKSICNEYAGKHDLQMTIHGNAFLTKDSDKIMLLQKAVQAATGYFPALSATGATTDGRFISHYCPVIECGMLESTMHQVDEHVGLNDIQKLMSIYISILKVFFLSAPSPSASEE